MWETIREFIIRRLVKMGSKRVAKLDFDGSKDIKRWMSIYSNNPPWVTRDKYGNELIGSRNLGTEIVSKLAVKSTVELRSEIVGGNVKAEYMNNGYQRLIDETREIVERLLVQGGGVLKPFRAEDGRMGVQYLTYDNFVPIKFNDVGELVKVAFIDTVDKGDFIYIKEEVHDYRYNGEYLITNQAYRANSRNASERTEVSLALVDEWANLESEEYFDYIEKPFFVYMKTPFVNNKNIDSPIGVSVLSKVEELIEDYDTLYSTMMWEYIMTSTELHADARLVNDELKVGDGTTSSESGLSGYNGRYRNKWAKMFRNFGPIGTDNWMDTFSPSIRDESYMRGLDKIARRIEDVVGLSRGDLSEHTFVAKTATEINANKQRARSTVKDIQKKITQAYGELVEVMSVMIVWYELCEDYEKGVELNIHFDDSIVMDKYENLELMMKEVNDGLLKKEYYLMKRYGKTMEEVQEMIPGGDVE